MKLLFIYGSPAVGKLTVSNEVARLTDFKVFHNHLSIDCVKPVFEFDSPPFNKIVELIRVETVREAARVGQNLIYTYCYAKDLDDAHVEKITKAVEENGGEVCFVLLKADKTEIEKRVTEDSRRQMSKIKTKAMLQSYFEKYDLFSPVAIRESLVIDNSALSAKAAAQQIVRHFGLPAAHRET